MSAFVSKLSALCSLLAAHVRSMLTLPEREVRDFPFVASDIAQLHRVRSDPHGPSIDDATWNDMLLAPYCAALSQETSIFGQQVLYQRLRAGAGEAQPETIKALLENPQRLQELHRECAPLRHADKQIASLLYEDARPPAPAWAGRTWPLPLALLASVIAVAWTPFAWLATFALL